MINKFAYVQRCISDLWTVAVLAVAMLLLPMGLMAAPYADFVIDARTGEVLHSNNADTKLHPASLTKMMTLYIAFEAIEHGEISLDTMVTVSKYAASQPPSRLGLRAGQKIALRYLIRAAAIKSANDAAAAIGDAIEGDKASFAKRMNRTAKALGMNSTSFRNANGLTEKGHMSTARDMVTLGRRVFYDFPQYYGIFSRRTADAGVATVSATNRRFLDAYEGADGIKTGYTAAAGFNLVASAQRGDKRIIASIFGGTSTAMRNARMAELLDLGFGKAPRRAKEQKPPAIDYMAHVDEEPVTEDLMAEAVAADVDPNNPAAGKTLRLNMAVAQSPFPKARGAKPVPEAVALAAADTADAAIANDAAEMAAATDDLMASMQDTITAALEDAQDTSDEFVQTTTPQPETLAMAQPVADAAAAVAPVEEAIQLADATPAAVIEGSASAPSETLMPLARPASLVADPSDAVAAAAPEATALVPTVTADAVAEPAVDAVEVAEATEPTLEAETPTATPVDPAASQLAAASIKLTPPAKAPEPQPETIVLASVETKSTNAAETAADSLEIVTRVSTSGGQEWGINVGSFPSRYNAERELLRTALVEMATLNDALRKVSSRKGAFDANFVGMDQQSAELACRRLSARGTECTVLEPTVN